MKNAIIHISYAKTNFKCPHCEKPYDDSEDIYLERCNKNKSGCTTIQCECELRFGMTYDIAGKAVSFKINKR
ncbi:hypothetical protein DRF62_02220 [Chryseobacterium piscium]|uniref:Uncharacterized protein n=1 Tax=Chryseobacterium piscium TaxID=333702 RepID=A0A3D9BUD3_9FLAO|nr:hypothetical protein [Chryseobacterium piscium]REC56996.1 hypothetical protein DRF62_02220 [Chryseobacterium piscium]